MDRKNMYRVPLSPSAVMRKLVNDNINAGKPAQARALAGRTVEGGSAANQTGKMLPAGQSAPRESAAVKPALTQPVNIKFDLNSFTKDNSTDSNPSLVSQEKLQDAIIWSEILGKPVSKRGKRRM